jgi:hypothetical protein
MLRLSSHLDLELPTGFFHSGFLIKIFLLISYFFHTCYILCLPHPPRFGHLEIGVKI